MSTIHLTALHPTTGRRFVAVGQTDRHAKMALYASVGRSDTERSFYIASEYFKMMRALTEIEADMQEKVAVIEYKGNERGGVRLYHGDFRNSGANILDGVVVTDPPYNVGYHYQPALAL